MGKINPFDTPDLRYVRHVQHPQVNEGAPVPVFEPSAPSDRPSINTKEGNNRLADQVNSRSFTLDFGRPPENRDELYAWVRSVCGECP